MKPTLLVLAAGMGSRYGGLKQLDQIGPNGETIIDYSIYDAIEAGFGKIVFVIRKSFEEAFKESFGNRFEHKIEVAYAFQEINVTIDGVNIPERTKPWGTAHAVLAAKDVINEPFAVINADDFYGSSSFKIVADFLKNQASPDHYCMVGFVLKNTISDNGTVSRGVCTADENNYLTSVVERTSIKRHVRTVVYMEDNKRYFVDENAVVSMNFWGLHPAIFEEMEKGFVEFVKANYKKPKAEYYIPLIVNDMIKEEKIKLSVLTSQEQWYGVTYKEDKQSVVDALQVMTDKKQYPSPLWS